VSFSASGEAADLSAEFVEEDLVADTRFDLDCRRVRLQLPGRQSVANALAALAAAEALGIQRDEALAAIEDLQPLPGRGSVERPGRELFLVDETYNANPEALMAVLAALQATRWSGRKVLALGDMLELGPRGPALHRAVLEGAAGAGVALLVAVGPLTAAACAQAASEMATAVFPDVDEAAAAAGRLIEDGDLVVVKGSRGMAMERFADAVRRHGEGG
jgi:UDP-N-acetylmuramoyl-tripeptide--D-alanyl-D-alanine ligase